MIAPRRSASRHGLAASLLALFVFGLTGHAAVPAFPGAEGFGANATGGRGGSVYVVTNLNDSGPGSFRDAVSQPNRYVVFAVGGVIKITSRIAVKNNITIAGQTAPGDGITIYGNGVSFSNANNTIVRYLRIRQGIGGDGGTDAVGIASGDSMIFDHVSASWGRDETFSVSGTPSNITLQDCIVGQGLLIHSAGGLMQTDGGVSVFRTLYADNWMRNPKVKGVHEFTNNIVYNWGGGGGYILGDSAGQSYANISNNYFIAGPNSPAQAFTRGNLNFHVFADNNFHDPDRNGVLDGAIVPPSGYTTVDFVPARYAYPPVATLLTPQQAYAHVVAHAGASLRRDAVDAYMIAELTSLGINGAQIVNESEVGGVGIIAGGVAPTDTDGDGMPDFWESAAGTNPAVADHNGDLNGDGYTNLENYLNALTIPGVPGATISGIDSDSSTSSTDGITSDTTLVLRGNSAPGRSIAITRADLGLIGTATADPSGNWSFDYTGTPLADRYYAFSVVADLGGGITSPPSRAFIVKVDTTAPVAPAIAGLVTNPAYAFTGTAGPGDIITITHVGVGIVGTATADELGRWTASYTGAPLAPGVYSFTAAAVDSAGNPGSDSEPCVVNTALTPPAFTAVQNDSGVSNSDQITNDPTLNLLGTAPASSIVTLTRAGTGIIGTTTADALGAWTFNYTGTSLPSADYSFTATASTGGTSSPVSTPFAVKIDTVAPTINTITRQNPATASTSASTLIFRVTFFEPVVNVDTGDFQLTTSGIGMTGAIASLTQITPAVYDVTITGAGGDGTLRLDRRANSTIQDLAGNVGSSSTFTGGQSYTMRLPGSGVWTNTETGGPWSAPANWEDDIVAHGAGATADFSTRDIDEQTTVHLDSARTIGRLVFADADQSATGAWTLTDNGNAANTLTLTPPSGGSPAIQVNFTGAPGQSNPDIATAGAAFPTILDVALNTSTGLTKSGWGTAIMNKVGAFSGPISVTQGRLKLAPGASLTVPTISLAVSTQFEVAGGNFTVTGDANLVSGTGVGYIVSAGTASFQRIIPTNARNNLVKVTGGALTATELNFPRSADGANSYGTGLVIQGGDSSIGVVGLGTVNSWGNMSIEGGRLAVDQLTIGFQQTSGRGGQARVLGGELVVNELVMSRKNGSNANNVAELHLPGGVTTVERLTLGFDNTVNAGSATVNLTGGTLYLGPGGIVRNGIVPFATNLNLTTGLLGARGDWSSSVPMTLGDNITLKTADVLNVPRNITLAGALGGSGGFTKTGGGTLTLAASNTFTGSINVNEGSLHISGSVAAGGSITLNGGALTGTGTINKPVVLNGATIATDAATPLSLGSDATLTWNPGGQLTIPLGATGTSGRLSIAGALTKGTSGSGGHLIAFAPGIGFAAGNAYTLATFASTNFIAADFTATGLPAGFAAQFSITGTTLDATIVGTPFITSAATASGTFNQPFSYTITAGNVPTSFSAIGLPPGLDINSATGVISGVPTAAGTFNATIRATNLAGTGTQPLSFTIAKAAATVSLAALQQRYDGTPRLATATTSPANLTVTFLYNGNATPPIFPGTYAVVATIDHPNYAGSTSGSLVITTAALVRQAPTLSGDIEGSLQVIQPGPVTLNSAAGISGDLLVPGTPTIVLNGQPTYGGTLDATGAAAPTGYSVTLNNNSLLRHVVRRVDPPAVPSVPAPQAPAGTQDITLNSTAQTVPDFTTLRNLTVNSNAGLRAIPPGAYGTFTANSSGFILGIAGATTPAVYHLQGLVLNNRAEIQVVGPVIVRIGNSVTFNGGTSGSANNPGWLVLEIANGGVTLNSRTELHAAVIAPAGTVTLNGATLRGRTASDQLVLGSQSFIEEAIP